MKRKLYLTPKIFNPKMGGLKRPPIFFVYLYPHPQPFPQNVGRELILTPSPSPFVWERENLLRRML